MGAPTPRMHGRTHIPGGSDPIPGLGAGGGGPAAQNLILRVSSTWDRVIPNNVPTRIRWELADTAAANTGDYFEFLDAFYSPASGSEFTYLGVKAWGALLVDGWVSFPIPGDAGTPPSANYQRQIISYASGGVAFAINEEWDHRVRNVHCSGQGFPFRSEPLPWYFEVQVLQKSGGPLTLSLLGSGAWCFVTFIEGQL